MVSLGFGGLGVAFAHVACADVVLVLAHSRDSSFSNKPLASPQSMSLVTGAEDLAVSKELYTTVKKRKKRINE